jgi:hypothetical protein
MHHVHDCPTAEIFSYGTHEQVNAVFSCSGNDPYSNTYILGWRNHPNFSWKAQALGNSTPRMHNQAQSSRPSYQPFSTYRSPQQQSQAPPFPPPNFDIQAQMMKLLSEIN